MTTLTGKKGTLSFVYVVSAYFLMQFLAIPHSTIAQANTFRGEITDEHLNCVQTPMKVPEEIKEKDLCVLYWAHFAEPSGKFVLYVAPTKTIYQVDAQSLLESYVGRKVEITGTIDAATKLVHIMDVKLI